MRRSAVTLSLAAVVLGLLSLGGTSALAAPRPLPEGDALYAIPCEYYSSEAAALPTFQLLDVDTTTAAAATIGTGTEIPDVDCVGQGAWDATTGTAYAVAFAWDAGGAPQLVTVDTETGSSTVVATFNDGTDPVDIYAIAIDASGNAFAAGSNGFYSLDLETAMVTYIGGSFGEYGLVFDPTSGVLYSLAADGELSSVDTATGVTTPLGNVLPDGGGTYSSAIDSDGILWFGIDEGIGGGDYEVILASVELADLTSFEESGTLTVGGIAPFQQSLFIAPRAVTPPSEPQLAATGAGPDPMLLAGAGILGLAGTALAGAGVVARRRAA